MNSISLSEIRNLYIEFFKSKSHAFLPSFSLVPESGDKSLLLINAGMAPLKDYFVGNRVPPSKRVVTCQKCVRTADLENVGKTERHCTFFEMLGNFSFGDYFKVNAIKWALEFTIDVLKISKDKLWITVYEKDLSTISIWHDLGISQDRIVVLGKTDNFWEIGEGPCGPCTEMYYDKGYSSCPNPNCAPGCDCDRFLEFWNLVFTEYEKTKDNEYYELANKNIDTGMGLERICSILNNVDNVFAIPEMSRIVDRISKLAGVEYGISNSFDVSLRIIADHIRCSTFLISDLVSPSNEGRGYVLRRLIRRSKRNLVLLGCTELILKEVAAVVVEEFCGFYPNLKEKQRYIEDTILIEEQKFSDTLNKGLEILKRRLDFVLKRNESVLDGETAFKLYDTFGFPYDLTREISLEVKIDVNHDEFVILMEQQKVRARSFASRGGFINTAEVPLPETRFLGYDNFSCESTILSISNSGCEVAECSADDIVEIVLDSTVFYAESGGQVADQGVLILNCECSDYQKKKPSVFRVENVYKKGKVFILKGIVESGTFKLQDNVINNVNSEKRTAISRNHTAVHLLQSALIKHIGNHISQLGSYVDDKKFRFDFSHNFPLTREEIEMIEFYINKLILKNLKVDTVTMNVALAKKTGAIALFDEKYGEFVRVVRIANENDEEYSKELCGGTHVSNTGEIGLFKILSETGVSSGVRRIEGITGYSILNFLKEKEKVLKDVSDVLKAKPNDIISRSYAHIKEFQDLQKKYEACSDEFLNLVYSNLSIKSHNDVFGDNEVCVMISKTPNDFDIDFLKRLVDRIKFEHQFFFAALMSKTREGAVVVVSCSEKYFDAINCSDIIKRITSSVEGRGGGRKNFAQCFIKDVSNLQKIFEIIECSLQEIR